MNAVVLVFAALCVFAIGYRFYGLFIAAGNGQIRRKGAGGNGRVNRKPGKTGTGEHLKKRHRQKRLGDPFGAVHHLPQEIRKNTCKLLK